MSLPIISILTPTRNRASSFLIQTILSVQNQIEDGFVHEHIIVDDNSDDNTQEVVENLAKKDLRIKYVRNNETLGVSRSLNNAFEHSDGSLVLPLDDDDLLMPRSLQIHFDFMRNDETLDWSYGISINIDEENRISRFINDEMVAFYADMQFLLKELFKTNFIANGVVIIKREALGNVGGWDSNVSAQDWDLWLNLLHHGYKVGFQKKYLGLKRDHSKQLTSTYENSGRFEKDLKYLLAKYNFGK